MIEANGRPTDRITRQAFHEFSTWTDRFSRTVRERARAAAGEAGEPGLITSEILAVAVRMACEDLAAELSLPCDGCNSSVQEDRRAA